MVLWIIAVFAAAFLVIIISMPVRCKIIYRREGQNDYFSLEMNFFRGLLPIRLEVPSIRGPRLAGRLFLKIRSKVTARGKKPVLEEHKRITSRKVMSQVKMIKENVYLLYPALLYMSEKTRVLKFKWESEIGLSDAARTGMVAGALWTLKGTAAGIIFRFTGNTPEFPELKINPVYDRNVFVTGLNCIFEAYPGHIIITAFKILKLKWQRNRGEKYAGAASN